MKKTKTLLPTILLALSLIMNGCAQKEEKYLETKNTTDKNTKNFLELKETLAKQIETQIEKQFYDDFNSYQVIYSHPEHLVSNQDVEDIKKIANTYQECTFNYTGTVEDMMNKIAENTEKYLNLHQDIPYINPINKSCMHDLPLTEITFTNYELFSNQIQETLRNTIKKMINQELSNNTMEDLCRMQDLIIVIDTTTMPNTEEDVNTLATYSSIDNKITIYLNTFLFDFTEQEEMILYDINKDIIPNEKIEILKKTMIHELNHMRENACKYRISKGQLYLENDISTALLESSSESAVYDETGAIYNYLNSNRNSISYCSEQEFEKELLLLTLTEPSTIDDFYACMFDTDLNKLFDFFHLTSEEDIKSFLNILKRQDGCLLSNSLAFDITSQDILNRRQAKNIVGVNYKIDLLRLSLRNLIEYNMKQESKLTKEEIITLEKIIIYQICNNSNLYKSDENGELIFESDGTLKYHYDPTFVEQLKTLENLFYDYIIQSYQISKEELFKLCKQADNTIEEINYRINTSSIPSDQTAISLLEKFPKLKSVFLGLYSLNDNSYKKVLTLEE